VCVEFVRARFGCVRDACMSVLLLLSGFRSAGMGVEVLLACFVSVLWFFAWRWFLLAFFVGIGRVSVV